MLAALWAADDPVTAVQVQSSLGTDLAVTTVITILNRLVDKGLATRTRAAGERAFRYAAVSERADHAADRMYAFLEGDSDHGAVLARFIGRLSDEDRRAMRDLLKRRR